MPIVTFGSLRDPMYCGSGQPVQLTQRIASDSMRRNHRKVSEDSRDTNHYHYTIRPKVYERAKGMCYACVRPVGRHWCCHHIRPVRRGGTNDLKNLVCLCVTCHDFVHTDRFHKRKLKRRLCFVVKVGHSFVVAINGRG